ncbi:hypothetical protein FGE12_28600 [Aggregicoccus sp. 17bor-14]|uniref:hypothetical protein n=1 Tax=Myxococcaceae TaxID=31 RepID=UPI00129D2190|nr:MULTISPECIES: hypothetical protein [Myxococcaceae]MBF5046408.1 hypothetical protein [Simulacricoccus sp. 17bor-14]MRI92128.1 hypothetical protein [Aggregicoccus sp. 17bor-14]
MSRGLWSALWAVVLSAMFASSVAEAASCTQSNGCQGTQVCTRVFDPELRKYISSCSCNPVPETCNNCDDDADGVVDNASGSNVAYSLTVSCSACGKTGAMACKAGVLGTCNAGPEVCNNCDDNGDGVVDNASGSNVPYSFIQSCSACGKGGTQVCSAGTLSGCNTGAEVCNNCDDNGDGVVDNAPGNGAPNTLTQVCSNGCSGAGSQTCGAGQWSACAGCSGTIACTTSCGVPSTLACNSSCQPTTNVCTSAEVCNGCDDNNNGAADEGLSCKPCQ